jgi:hypothetical protein
LSITAIHNKGQSFLTDGDIKILKELACIALTVKYSTVFIHTCYEKHPEQESEVQTASYSTVVDKIYFYVFYASCSFLLVVFYMFGVYSRIHRP